MKKRDQTNPVTDHALLRYLQRERGVDIEAIRDGMADDFVRAACKAGATKVIIGHTEFRICPEGKVRTVVNRKAQNKSKPSHVDGRKHSSKNRRKPQRTPDYKRHGRTRP